MELSTTKMKLITQLLSEQFPLLTSLYNMRYNMQEKRIKHPIHLAKVIGCTIYASWPQSTMEICWEVRPEALPRDSICFTTSIPAKANKNVCG